MADTVAIKDPLSEIWFGRPIRRHLIEFAQVMALVCLVISGIITYKHGITLAGNLWLVGAAAVLLVGYTNPAILHVPWKGWMKLGHALGFVMSFVILGIAWIGMMVPLALILKAVGKRTMDLRFGAPVESYWEIREGGQDFKLLEKQY